MPEKPVKPLSHSRRNFLKNAGLVDDRKEGSMTYYSLRVKCLTGFFTCIESVLKQNLHAQEKILAHG